MEEWKKVEGYDYEVSNLGNVRSLDRQVRYVHGFRNCKGKLIRPCKINSGYLTVNFSKHSKSKRFTVHRLVAKAFIPNPENLPIINHKNEIKNDNRVENLEWCTASENSLYGGKNTKHSEFMKGRFTGSKHHNSKPKEYYSKNAVPRGNFKATCIRVGWDFNEFTEVFSHKKKSKHSNVNYFFYIAK